MKKILMVMDPIEGINPKKDSTFAMMLEAQAQGMQVFYAQGKDMWVDQGQARVSASSVQVMRGESAFFEKQPAQKQDIQFFDAIVMRIDPPFNMEYIYTTYILDMAKAAGVRVYNDPQSLRDCNEKMFIQWFPKLIAPTLVSKHKDVIFEFVEKQKKAVIKPLDGMGGEGIFVLDVNDPNMKALIDQGTQKFTQTVMIQKYLPEVTQGDKRILVVHGEVIPYSLARIPQKGQARANLASGGMGVAMALSAAELTVCNSVAPELKKRGLSFVGMDMIGESITEINVTSPTCIQEIEAAYPEAEIAKKFISGILDDLRA